MDLKDLENLIVLLKANDICEFELEHDGMKVKLQRGVGGLTRPLISQEVVPVAAAATLPVAAVTTGGATPTGPVSTGLSAGLFEVKSPIVGTFYRKPSPDAELFVKEGDRVKKGDTLCIIEAMKLMNEIEAPVDGRVEKILLSDARVVEYGETLFLLNTSA